MLLHLLEHTVGPIISYGCEIWGTENILSSKIKRADLNLEYFACYKLLIESLNNISSMDKK